MLRVTIYNEYRHEVEDAEIARVYPQGIHGAIAQALKADDVEVRCVTLNDIDTLTEEALNETDVLIWWGHMAHHLVPDEVAQRVRDAVLKGMGAIFLHSGHHSKPFRLLMGTSCNLTWREDGDMECVWVVNPAHPIAQGLGRWFTLPHVETYGEPFGIPNPDEVVFIGWYEGGEVFRSGVTFHRENGRIFYFQPGHETFPIFYDENLIRVLRNAVRWAAPVRRIGALECPHVSRPED